MLLKDKIISLFAEAFDKLYSGSKEHLAGLEITKSTNPKFGHYQCNSAMKLAKLCSKAPREVASEIISAIPENDILFSLEIAGPGFINITLKHEYISQFCQTMTSANLGIDKPLNREKIVLDFSSPNTAKEMHVGHLRSTIIGDCLARLFEYLGHETLRLNHIGDWGTSFGMLIAYIKQNEPDLISNPAKATLSELVAYYKKAKLLFDSNDDFKQQAQLEVVSLQSGNKESKQIWETICQISRSAYQEIYNLLDVDIIERGESFYNPYLSGTVADLESKNLINISDGAKCIFIDGFENRDGEPLPMIVQKSDGGYNYSTTDIAAVRHRVEVEHGNRIIYVIDSGQSTHLQMLFATAKKAGYAKDVRLDHVAFGLVLGPDGKKFKTRSGDTEKLIDLLTSGIDKANTIITDRIKANQSQIDPDNISEAAQSLAINAIKYSDLSNNRIHDYAFNFDRMLQFEGNTAAFLMYSYVRIGGIRRKSEYSDEDINNAAIKLLHAQEVNLGLHIAQFHDLLTSVTEDLMPHRLCDYLFELANHFNAFFRDCRVVGDNDELSRLKLCDLTANVLAVGLNILGLKLLYKM